MRLPFGVADVEGRYRDLGDGGRREVDAALLGHGQWDDKVLYEQQAHGVGVLRELGVDVTDESYPMGHSSHPKETRAVADFLERVLFPSK